MQQQQQQQQQQSHFGALADTFPPAYPANGHFPPMVYSWREDSLSDQDSLSRVDSREEFKLPPLATVSSGEESADRRRSKRSSGFFNT